MAGLPEALSGPTALLSRAVLGLAAVCGIALCLAAPARADMAITNLNKVDTAVIEKQGWSVKKQRSRITLFCNGCADFTATDIILDRATDGTEGRIRSGKTTAKTMMDICKQNAKTRGGGTCHAVTPVRIKGAVGFLNDVSLGPMGYAATYVLWQDGRRLTIRNVASTRRAAKQNGQVMLKALAPQIVR